MTFRDVAERVRASLSSIVRWSQTHQQKGLPGLKERVDWGRPSLLTPDQKDDLRTRLLNGAVAAGHSTELWTLKRIEKLIEKQYGVRYTSVGVWRLLRLELKWSCQKPEKRALQRDEENIRRWKQRVWPHIKKGQKTWSPPGISRRKRVSADP
jgi:transposase